MLFSSIPFLYYFLPVVLAVYFLVPRSWRNAVLLMASLVFYDWGEPRYLLLMVGTILVFYVCGLGVGRVKGAGQRKVLLILSLVIGLGLLAVFKYADFFVENFAAMTGLNLPLLKLALPIGISFYTFQCVSYVVDVYRGTVPAQRSPIAFGAYVALFPQLIAGPIVRYADIARELENRHAGWEDLQIGLRRFLVGLGKKILLANQLGELAGIYRASGEKSLVFCWMYAIAFSLQIYFDFSGYSDMAIGLGRILGFHFNENFNYPYLSKSVTEFWRRWHMSLGTWFRDYVYIPMGGSRVRRGRWVCNILTVWMLTGLWHGASWNFVVWGLFFGLLLMLEKWLKPERLPGLVRHGYVVLAVVISFVIFGGENLGQAWQDILGMFGAGGLPLMTVQTAYYLRSYAVILALSILGAAPLVRNLSNRIPEKIAVVLEPIAMIALLLVCSAYLVDGSFNPFLYFRF
ncbi:MAG: MBOAT family protein [Oscillospiraceae bacterium]|nr:MBOAT family protein [Oscillospiraceae bacterium]